MLIECDRHTAADLAHWRKLELQDQLYARTHERRLRAMANRSVEHIERFVSKGPCYLGVSWGKDSVLLATLAHECEIEVPLVCIAAPGYENPHNSLVRDAVPWGSRVEVIEVRVERGSQAHVGEHGRHDAGYRIAAARFGDRYLSGVRADESYARTQRALWHGVATERTCAPLTAWTNQDVFAWAALRSIPLHPVYGMTAGGRFPREHLRVSSIGHQRGVRFGQREWERCYYPDELREQTD